MINELTGDYRRYMDKNFLGEWDLPEEDDLILTIDFVSIDEVTNERGKEKKMCVHFEENYKPLIMNATNGKAISKALNTSRVERWGGKKIQLYRDEIFAFGEKRKCVRVRPTPPREEIYYCEECGQEIKQQGKYTARAIADSSRKKYGKPLCMECAKAEKERLEAEAKGSDILG